MTVAIPPLTWDNETSEAAACVNTKRPLTHSSDLSREGLAVKRSRYTDQQIIDAYQRHGSVWKTGDALGLSGQQVHARLAAIGATKPIRVFTDAERDRLRRDYIEYRAQGRVAELAAEMGRTVQFLSRQARALGLTTHVYPRLYSGKWKHMTDASARALMDAFKASPLGLMQFCALNGYDDEGFRNTLRSRWPDEWEHVVESKTPLSTKYRLGRAVEYRFRDRLKKAGYVVLRSPASRSPLDLVAIRPDQVLFIQCKRSGALPPVGWNALYDMAESAGAVPILAENPWPKKWNYWRLTDRKDGSKRRQPMVPFDITEATP